MSFLIAGYTTLSREEKEKYDIDALCNAIGNLMFILAGIIVLSSIGIILEISWIINSTWLIFTMITIAFVVYENIGNRYKK